MRRGCSREYRGWRSSSVVARAHVRVVVAASTNGALGRDDLNRRGGRTEFNLDRGFTSRRRATAFTRKRDYEDTGAFTENREAPLQGHNRC